MRAGQVDDGSERIAARGAACNAWGIALFELPPQGPTMIGRVEHASPAFREEFWA